MAPTVPLLAVRGSDRTELLCGPPSCEQHPAFQRDSRPGRNFTFSRDGTLFGWCNGHRVSVVKASDGSLVASLDLPKTALLDFSPLCSVLVTWQPYSKTADSPQGEANLQLWEVTSGRLIKALYQKKVESWCPSWSEDEKICVRSVNNELHFYENNDFSSIANKLQMQKVSDFALSPGDQPSKVAIYVPGSKGAPSFVRLYQYPVLGGLTAALANKSFFKADRVSMQWNRKASALLVTTITEVDKTGASYYGEQTLHYLAVNGETAVVQLSKNGPIYDVAWSPGSGEFCVVYGFMPAKATIFNLKCEPLFDFGTGPRNAAYYSPQGHILVLAGFGNLRGQMEVWDVKKYKQVGVGPLDRIAALALDQVSADPPGRILAGLKDCFHPQVSKPQAPDATHFSWCPDGEHIVTATCSPRLRVGNGYKVWHYTGSVLHQQSTPGGAELWEVRWQSFPSGAFPERPVKYQPVPSELGTTQAPPTQAYRPPALRHLPATASSKLHEEEPPQDLRSGPPSGKGPSKTALKNQKKREARKAANQDAKPTAVICSLPPAPSDEPEYDKKVKNLKKKLKAIEELKEEQQSGKVLQKNQIEKIQKEEQLLKELQELQVQ